MLVSEAPMVSRSAARPDTNRWSWSMSSLSAASCSSTVPSTVLRLLIVRPMTSSRSARVEVRDAVLASSELMLPPSPCRTLMMLPDSSLTSLGDSAANSGLNPLNRTVRSRADWVWSSPMVAPSLSGRAPPDLLGQGDVALADEVAVLDGRLGALGEDAGLQHLELDVGVDAVVGDLDAGDLTDPDPGDAHLLAVGEPGDVVEHRGVGRLVAELDVGDGGRPACRSPAGSRRRTR